MKKKILLTALLITSDSIVAQLYNLIVNQITAVTLVATQYFMHFRNAREIK